MAAAVLAGLIVLACAVGVGLLVWRYSGRNIPPSRRKHSS